MSLSPAALEVIQREIALSENQLIGFSVDVSRFQAKLADAIAEHDKLKKHIDELKACCQDRYATPKGKAK